MTTRQLAHEVLTYLERYSHHNVNAPSKEFLDNVEQLALDVVYWSDSELPIDVEMPNGS